MSGDTVDEFMMTPVLRGLIAEVLPIALTKAGGVNQRKTKRAVIRFVRTILAVGKHGHAVFAALVGQVKPLMGRDLIFSWRVVAPLHRADIPIVSGHRIGSSERKGALERCCARFPINRVGELHAITGFPGSQADDLDEPRAFCFSLNT